MPYKICVVFYAITFDLPFQEESLMTTYGLEVFSKICLKT